MSKKSKSKSVPQKKPAPKPSERDVFSAAIASFLAATAGTIDGRRKALLAQVAGTVAAGLVTSPSPSIASPSGMATAAVDIAEEILKRVGIPATEPAVETAEASSVKDGVGAAS